MRSIRISKKKKKLIISLLGLLVFMFIINFIKPAMATPTTAYFTDWNVGNDNDYYYLKEYDGTIESDYKNLYYLKNVYSPTYNDDKQLAVDINALTTYTKYGFSQGYFEVDDNSFLRSDGNYKDSGFIGENNYTSMICVDGSSYNTFDTGSYAVVDNNGEYRDITFDLPISIGSSDSHSGSWHQQTNYTFSNPNGFESFSRVSMYLYLSCFASTENLRLRTNLDGWSIHDIVVSRSFAGDFQWYLLDFYVDLDSNDLDDLELSLYVLTSRIYVEYVYCEIVGVSNFDDLYTDNSGTLCEIQLTDYNGHKNVLELNDKSTTAQCSIQYDYDYNQEFGTIEFYMLSQDTSYDQYIQFYDGATRSFYLYFNNDNIYVRDGGSTIVVENSVNDDEWYHIKIEFASKGFIPTSYNYKYLTTDTYRVYINGVNKGVFDFETSTTGVDNIKLYSQIASVANSYYDAFGFESYIEYEIDDNLYDNEVDNSGLENFDTSYRLYDDSNNIKKRIGVNTKINESNIDYEITHESYDGSFYSEINEKSFYNDGYGDYNGTYSFTNDLDVGNPTDWTIDESGGSVKVIEKITNHNDVLEIYDTSATYQSKADNTFSNQEFGTIEFYFRTTDTQKISYFILLEGSNQGVVVYCYLGNLYYSDGVQKLITTISSNFWHHIRIDFECGSSGYLGLSPDTFKICLNDVEYGAYGFFSARSNINTFSFRSHLTQSLYHSYLDGVGYSWDDDYDIGDNFEQHNLESFNGINEIIENVEIQTHCRIGLNNESIKSINIQIIIRINENNSLIYTYEHYIIYDVEIPTDKLGLECVKYYRTYPYTHSQYFNNDLRGLRVLYDDLGNDYNHFVDFGCWSDDIYVKLPEPPTQPEPNPDEPSPYYWYYTAIEIGIADSGDIISVGVDDGESFYVEMEFPLIEISAETEKFYYYVLSNYDLGDWSWAWNWLRDALAIVFNVLLIIPVQFMLYLLVVAFNFIIMFLIIGGVAVIFWNIIIKNLFIGLLYVLYALWILVYILLPIFLEWFFETFLPIFLELLAYVLAIIIGTMVWLLTFGTGDLDAIISVVNQFLDVIFDFVYTGVMFVITNLFTLILGLACYLIVIYMLYGKIIYTGSKGFTSRQAEASSSLKIYSFPIRTISKMTKTTWNMFPKL